MANTSNIHSSETEEIDLDAFTYDDEGLGQVDSPDDGLFVAEVQYPDQGGQYADDGQNNYYGDDAQYAPQEGGGYFDENGNYVDENGNYGDPPPPPGQQGGYFDENGNYVDEHGNYADPPPPSGQQGGYFDENGNYVDEHSNYADPPPPPVQQGGGYFDQDGNYIDENGNYADPPPPAGQQGGYFDQDGNYVDEHGNYADPPPPAGQQGGYFDQDGNYVDENGNYADPPPPAGQQGGYFDEDGNYVDENGNYADPPPPTEQQGGYFDENGNYVDEHGNYVDPPPQTGGYFDDEGNYIDENGNYAEPPQDAGYYNEDGEFVRDDPLEEGPSVLLSILEAAMPKSSDGNDTEAQVRRELVEKTWGKVREWLWKHQDMNERADAAYLRGNQNLTPLHLVCMQSHPPLDIIDEIVAAAPDVCGWPCSNGHLPLHYLCNKGASVEVLRTLVDAYPDSCLIQGSQNRTPLHFYVARNNDNAMELEENTELLASTGAAEVLDANGMLPFHLACTFGTLPVVLEVLVRAYPDCCTARENKGRTPMHLAMVNSSREHSPSVMRFLLESGGRPCISMRDHSDGLPLHSVSTDNIKSLLGPPRENVTECLRIYLSAEPYPDPDFLTALQDLPEWLLDEAVITSHVRSVLNEKIVQRFPTSIMLLDATCLMVLIVFFELVSGVHIDIRFGLIPEDEVDERIDEVKYQVYIIMIGAGYFLGRELIQIFSLIAVGGMKTWFVDTTNYLDLGVIFLTMYYAIMMLDDSWGDKERFRAGCAFTKGVLWLDVIYFLKSTLVDFAVFVGGVYYVVRRLIAFLIGNLVILLVFAQMFWIIYAQKPICTSTILQYEDDPNYDTFVDEFCDIEDGTPRDFAHVNTSNCDVCRFPHCEFENSFFKVYVMMMGEIGSEQRYATELLAQILYLCYAFLVVILLSNVLIAIVTDLYEVIQHDRAAIVFWQNRLDFVAEMDAITYGIKKKYQELFGDLSSFIATATPSKVREGSPEGESPLGNDKDESVGIFEFFWNRFMEALFDELEQDGDQISAADIEFWIRLWFQVVIIVLIIPCWLLVGALTFGWLWPPQVRGYLFIQKDTKISRSELERKKLEQLKHIQDELRQFKEDLGREMAGDREDILRMKGEVDAVQGEVLSDLVQVKQLMTALLKNDNEGM